MRLQIGTRNLQESVQETYSIQTEFINHHIPSLILRLGK